MQSQLSLRCDLYYQQVVCESGKGFHLYVTGCQSVEVSGEVDEGKGL